MPVRGGYSGTGGLPASLLREFDEEIYRTFRSKTVPRLQRVTPVRTGLLRRSWEAEKRTGGGAIVNRVRYAGFVNRGRFIQTIEREFERSVRTDLEPALQRAVDRWSRGEGRRYFERMLMDALRGGAVGSRLQSPASTGTPRGSLTYGATSAATRSPRRPSGDCGGSVRMRAGERITGAATSCTLAGRPRPGRSRGGVGSAAIRSHAGTRSAGSPVRRVATASVGAVRRSCGRVSADRVDGRLRAGR